MTLWMHHLLPWLLIPMAVIPGLWMAFAGVALRRLAQRFPLGLAVPAAWMLAELLRWCLPEPLSFGWWRLGMFAADTDWVLGSARVWGTWGLSWVLAAFGGWCADLLRLRDLDPVGWQTFPHRQVHVLGVGPLALAFVLCLPAHPDLVPGPRVLVVQPGIEQSIKAFSSDPIQDLYRDAVDLTYEGLAAAAQPVDLVAWGESMLPFLLPDQGVIAAHARGMGTSDWAGWKLDQRSIEMHASGVANFVRGILLGDQEALDTERNRWGTALAQMGSSPWLGPALRGEGVLPPGTSFMSGLLTWVVSGDVIRKQNSAALWGPDGEPPALAAKVNLVPGAEQAEPYTSLPFVLSALKRVGGYIPDFVAAERAAVLPLKSRDGRTYSMGVSICYDNVFDEPYAEPLRRGPVDFFCILSNEAWYKDSVEMDHLVALTQMTAASCGRSILRVTNSGVSILVSPEGRIEEVLEDAKGRRKMVRGTLDVQIPVPQEAQSRLGNTLWVRTGHLQPLLWAILVGVLLLFSGGGVTPRSSGVRPSQSE